MTLTTPPGKGGGTPKSTGLYHIRGGYADTYIHFQTKTVYKYCDAYYRDHDHDHDHNHNHNHETNPKHDVQLIHYSTVCDLVFSKALAQLHGFPRIHSVEHRENDGKIRITMDYLGKTVHDAARTYSKQTRFQLAGRFLEYLVATCYNLWYNGIQHTDLKPGNILVDNHDQFHLIDFNCMSLMRPDGHWCPAIGTWQYVSPEILMTEHPHQSSMVWSIAMILAYWLLGTYPISSERMGRYSQITPSSQSQSQWKHLMTNIRRKYPDFLQLEQRYVAELGEWWPRLCAMLRWNPHRRWTLERVIQSLYPLKIHVRTIVLPVVSVEAPEYIREHILTKGATFLHAIRMESLMVQTAILFDRCYMPLKDTLSSALLWLCAWAIQGYLTNQFLFDNDNIVLTVHQHYSISCDQILQHIYTVLNACDCTCWQRDWFLYLAPLAPLASQAGAASLASLTSSVSHIDWQRVLRILLEQKEFYSPESIAKAYQQTG